MLPSCFPSFLLLAGVFRSVNGFSPSINLKSVLNTSLLPSFPRNTSSRLHSATDNTVMDKPKLEMQNENDSIQVNVEFSHVHLYVDHIDDMDVYKEIENDLNTFASNLLDEGVTFDRSEDSSLDIEKCSLLWNADENGVQQEFIPQKRDIVKQLLAGLGFRVVGECDTPNTKSLLLTTKDRNGVQFIISAIENKQTDTGNGEKKSSDYHHFAEKNIQSFYEAHANRQGIAVLAFQITSGDVSDLFQKYKNLHPQLICEECKNGPLIYNGDEGSETKVFEVYSYYKVDKGSEVDRGTRLRFIQKVRSSEKDLVLPGLKPVEAKYDHTCMAAYCDHWVSNVVSRTGFIDTLEETLGFAPKVDFNAGVVAAGEAQIESTVTGNDSSFFTDERGEALKDQSQIYLPINNAMSEVGHVHGFLEELGQGIQHIASRVDDLPTFVQRANDYREVMGEGFTFLNIPRSYYGVLSEKLLCEDVDGISEACASRVMEMCEKGDFMTLDGAVALNISQQEICKHLDNVLSIDDDVREEYETKKKSIVEVILRSRYSNMHSLLGDGLSEETYVSIVRNQILVDVQGSDLLFQIFTSNILQRNPGDESPFLEFIQRVCSVSTQDDKPVKMKAGCGGFGIRNFLTLFLSIEVGKAMLDLSQARTASDADAANLAQRKVDIFTDQLNEANPILTEISDAMTEEGFALTALQEALARGDLETAAEFEAKRKLAGVTKIASNEKLMACSSKYNSLMKSLRVNSNNIK